jgi:hypothetical protein
MAPSKLRGWIEMWLYSVFNESGLAHWSLLTSFLDERRRTMER